MTVQTLDAEAVALTCTAPERSPKVKYWWEEVAPGAQPTAIPEGCLPPHAPGIKIPTGMIEALGKLPKPPPFAD